MRPEYLAEFEAAGVTPPSDLPLRDQAAPRWKPAIPIPQAATCKVILKHPGISGNVVAENLAAIAVGTLKLLLMATIITVGIFAAVITGFVRGSRKGRRRRT